jgi:hypothetical protein
VEALGDHGDEATSTSRQSVKQCLQQPLESGAFRGGSAALVLGGQLKNVILRERAKPVSDLCAVSSEQDRGGLRGDAEGLPRLERTVPQHGERLRAKVIDEVFCLAEAVLGPQANHFNFLEMITSELLDIESFSTAERSMGCPHPDQHWPVGREHVAQVDLGPAPDVVDQEVGQHL